jgi:hypothetical protein
MLYTFPTPQMGVTGFIGRQTVSSGLQRTTAMAIEIFYLTAQIRNWLNARVARHLAAQAERLAR